MRRPRGFTLVELMIVVAIVGVLGALAVYGVRGYVLHAKTAEARNAVGQIAKDAAAVYDRETMAGSVMGLQSTTGTSGALCSSTSSVPATIDSVRGVKYQSAPSEWTNGNWVCLRFSMQDPQYYMYRYYYEPGGPFGVIAVGDLDGDGLNSQFRMEGAAVGGMVHLAANIDETNSDE